MSLYLVYENNLNKSNPFQAIFLVKRIYVKMKVRYFRGITWINSKFMTQNQLKKLNLRQ